MGTSAFQGLRTVIYQVESVGEGIRVATVKDPFDNVVGIIENPHFELPDAA